MKRIYHIQEIRSHKSGFIALEHVITYSSRAVATAIIEKCRATHPNREFVLSTDFLYTKEVNYTKEVKL